MHHILPKTFSFFLTTSKTSSLLSGEFILKDWSQVGLNVETAVKRGIYTVHQNLIAQKVGKLSNSDLKNIDDALRLWLGL